MTIEDSTLTRVSNATYGVFTVPDNVTAIGQGAFDGCQYITEIVIPDSVTKINESAFQDGYIPEFNVTYKGKTYKPNQLERFFQDFNKSNG